MTKREPQEPDSPANALPVNEGPAPSEAPLSGLISADFPSKLLDGVPKLIPFEKICRCGNEVWIEYRGQVYRLRATKQGKLILTK